jgi:hypothetical protein
MWRERDRYRRAVQQAGGDAADRGVPGGADDLERD